MHWINRRINRMIRTDAFLISTAKKYADIIIPRGGENTTGIHILQEHLKLILG